MGFFQHKKQTEYSKSVMRILNEKYDGNLLRWRDAENELKQTNAFLNKLKDINYISGEISLNKESQDNKVTHIDFNNDMIDLAYTQKLPEPLLAYTLEYLSVKRIMPFSISQLIDNNKNKDYKKKKDTHEVARVLEYVKERVLTLNFTLQGINLDKKNGIFTYTTSMQDRNYGNVKQFITVRYDADKKLHIPTTDLTGTIQDLSNQYSLLLMYFMMFGFNEIFCRCTCQDYILKYSKRQNISNYFCSHILYSLAQMPWYLETVLNQ